MINCVQRGRDAEAAYLASITCNMRELQSSHGGGNDYSAPCVLHTNEKGKHRGNHRTAQGYAWKPGPNDRRL